MGELAAYRAECGGAVYWLAMWRHASSITDAAGLIAECQEDPLDDEVNVRALTDEEAARVTVGDEDDGPMSLAAYMLTARIPHIIACSEWP